MRRQDVCHRTLPWLILFSLDGMSTQSSESDRRSSGRFPGDLAALISLPFITLVSCVFSTWLVNSPSAVIWCAALPGFAGLLLLTWARLPLYRQLQFFSFGPRRLDAVHRRAYWRAYVLIAISVLALLAYIITR